MLTMARTASRCTRGSLSFSSSVRSGSASVPPNSRSRRIAVLRTAAFGEFFSRSAVRRPTAPNATRIAVIRSRVRTRSSAESASASGRISTSPRDTHMSFTRRTASRRSCRGATTTWRIIGPATSMSMAVSADCRRPFDPSPVDSRTMTASSCAAASKSPTSSRSSSMPMTVGVSARPFLVVVLRCSADRAGA